MIATGLVRGRMSPGAHASPSRQPSLLLVGRRDDTREAFARDLRHHGFDVKTASDLARAMELSRQRSFDLLMSDATDRGGVTGELARLLELMYAQGRAAGTFELEMLDELGVGFEVFVIRPVGSETLLADVFKSVAGTPTWSSGRGEA